MDFRTGYNYDRDAVSFETGLRCDPDEGRTQQQFKEESDINEIVRRFGLTGELPSSPRPPQYGDFSGVSDFASAMLAVRRAEEGFMEFPADVRARFGNDPQQMVVFLADEGNREEAVKLGLVKPKAEVDRDDVIVAPPAPPEPAKPA